MTHILSDNEGYGNYVFSIASQANSNGTKQLLGITIISIGTTQTYFNVVHNGCIVRQPILFEEAVKIYNEIKL